MLYLGIDQHAKQLTIDLGDEGGNLLLHRQVKTQWKPLRAFLEELRKQAEPEGGFVAIVEVCGFNNYLLELLEEYDCARIVLVQPEERKKIKTDRRDARALRESLWINRERLREGKRLANLRVVRPASKDDAADRQLTALRKRLVEQRTSIINRVKTILRKWNLQHDCPTKGIQTKLAFSWLACLELPKIDRMEMDILLEQWRMVEKHLEQVEEQIRKHQPRNQDALLVSTIPGMKFFNSLTVASRVGNIDDFPRGGSLANFWGITPGARNSGDKTNSLHITKAGSSLVRYVLGQAVLHVIRKDPWMRQWYQKIKRRRGSKIARVAVMRRLATIIWAMLKYRMPYIKGGPEKINEYRRKHGRSDGNG
jgi:transposase